MRNVILRIYSPFRTCLPAGRKGVPEGGGIYEILEI